MPDKVYCYPDSNVLINKLNIRDNIEDYYNYYSCDDDQVKIQKYDAYYEEKVARSKG